MVLGSRQRDSVQPGAVQDPVHDELHRDCSEQEAHHPTDGASAGASESPEDAVRIVKQDERDEDGHEDPGEDKQLVRRIVDRMGHVDHHGRDRAGAREQRDADGHHGDLTPLERRLPPLRRQPRAGALASEHLERDAKQDDAARDLEGGNREPERGEDPLAEDREDAEGDRRREAGFRDDVLLLRGVRSSVRTEKNGTTPRGSTIAKMEAMAVAPNAKSTMVVPETDGGLVPSHQFHPAAALVYGEIAAAGGPFELIPGGDLGLLAAALREPQRVRAPNLARPEG